MTQATSTSSDFASGVTSWQKWTKEASKSLDLKVRGKPGVFFEAVFLGADLFSNLTILEPFHICSDSGKKQPDQDASWTLEPEGGTENTFGAQQNSFKSFIRDFYNSHFGLEQ